MRSPFRTPSLKKSFFARTTGRWKRMAKRAVVPGYGMKGMGLAHPKRALYNKVYSKTSISTFPYPKSDIKRNDKAQRYIESHPELNYDLNTIIVLRSNYAVWLWLIALIISLYFRDFWIISFCTIGLFVRSLLVKIDNPPFKNGKLVERQLVKYYQSYYGLTRKEMHNEELVKKRVMGILEEQKYEKEPWLRYTPFGKMISDYYCINLGENLDQEAITKVVNVARRNKLLTSKYLDLSASEIRAYGYDETNPVSETDLKNAIDEVKIISNEDQKLEVQVLVNNKTYTIGTIPEEWNKQVLASLDSKKARFKGYVLGGKCKYPDADGRVRVHKHDYQFILEVYLKG